MARDSEKQRRVLSSDTCGWRLRGPSASVAARSWALIGPARDGFAVSSCLTRRSPRSITELDNWPAPGDKQLAASLERAHADDANEANVTVRCDRTRLISGLGARCSPTNNARWDRDQDDLGTSSVSHPVRKAHHNRCNWRAKGRATDRLSGFTKARPSAPAALFTFYHCLD